MLHSKILTAVFLPYLFLSITLLTSCQGQQTPPAQEVTEEVALPPSPLIFQPDTSGQIGQYILDIHEDRQGHLWFGTLSKGAARYDGQTLTYFSTKDGLCDNAIVSITEDQAGHLWFGTHAGASKYNGLTFTTFGEAEGLHGMGCNLLVDRKGTLWAATNHGVFRFDGRRFLEFELPIPESVSNSYKWEAGKVWCLLEDSHGHMWFGRDGYGACQWDGHRFTHFTKRDGLSSNNISRIVEDQRGHIWFGALSSDFPEYINEGGLSRYDGETITPFPQLKGLNQNDIYTIYQDPSGDLWIGAIGHGVYYYDGENFTLFDKSDRIDLVSRFGLQGILKDQKGTLWCGFSGGLFRFDGEIFLNVMRDGPWE